MKIIKVAFRRGANGLEYPARYNAQEIERYGKGPGDLAKGSIAYSGGLNRGEPVGHTLIALEDELADEYAQDPDMEIITPEEADALREEWRIAKGEPEERVESTAPFLLILAKKAAGMELSEQDFAALDVDDHRYGVHRRNRPTREAHPHLEFKT